MSTLEGATASERQQHTDNDVSVDRVSTFHLSDAVLRSIYLLLGVGILLPWNAFVSSKPYFAARLCGDSGDDIVNFEQYFALVWNLSSVLSLGLIIGGKAIADYFTKTRTTLSDVVAASPLNQNSNGSHNNNSTGDGDPGNNSPSAYPGHNNKYDYSSLMVMLPLTLYMAVFSLQTILVLFPHISPPMFLVVTLCGLAVCGTCGAIATAGIVSTAGQLPSHVGVNPFFSGQALGGVAVSLANFVVATVEDPYSYFQQHCSNSNGTSTFLFNGDTTIARLAYTTQHHLGEDGPNHACSPYQKLDWAVFSYFLAGCAILFLCLIGYHMVHTFQQQDFRDDYELVHNTAENITNGSEAFEPSPRIGLELNDRRSHRARDQEESGTIHKDQACLVPSLSMDGAAVGSSHDSMAATTLSTVEDDVPPQSFSSCINPCREIPDQTETRRQHDDYEDEYTDELNEGAVFSAIKGPAICIFLTFSVTLCLFPSWLSELRSSQECKNHFRLNNDLYVPFSFLFFNIGDFLGRILAGLIPVEKVQNLSRKLVLGSLLRVVFFPLFLACLSTVGIESSFVIRSDLFSITVQFLFAVTNGLLVSTSFMWSPHLVGHSIPMQERASEIMTFSVCFGLLSGSLLAFPFLQMATRLLQ